jgi:hypothetical protein
MSPFETPDDIKEQSERERLEIARRYREQHGRELRELIQPEVEGDVLEVGEFSTVPIEALAAVPFLGAFLALATRVPPSRRGLGRNVLLTLDRDDVYLLSVGTEKQAAKVSLVSRWPRSAVRVTSVEPRFMREAVTLEIEGQEPLTLFASSLRTNPWGAALIRALGGKAPDPLDLRPSDD